MLHSVYIYTAVHSECQQFIYRLIAMWIRISFSWRTMYSVHTYNMYKERQYRETIIYQQAARIIFIQYHLNFFQKVFCNHLFDIVDIIYLLPSYTVNVSLLGLLKQVDNHNRGTATLRRVNNIILSNRYYRIIDIIFIRLFYYYFRYHSLCSPW